MSMPQSSVLLRSVQFVFFIKTKKQKTWKNFRGLSHDLKFILKVSL